MTAAVLGSSRRGFLAGAASLAAMSLAGCASERMRITTPQFSDYYLAMYGPLPDEKFPVPPIDLSNERLLKLAAACEVDVAITSLPVDAAFEQEPLFAEELLLALPPAHHLARKRTVKAADLDGERFIVMKEGHCLGD